MIGVEACRLRTMTLHYPPMTDPINAFVSPLNVHYRQVLSKSVTDVELCRVVKAYKLGMFAEFTDGSLVTYY